MREEKGNGFLKEGMHVLFCMFFNIFKDVACEGSSINIERITVSSRL